MLIGTEAFGIFCTVSRFDFCFESERISFDVISFCNISTILEILSLIKVMGYDGCVSVEHAMLNVICLLAVQFSQWYSLVNSRWLYQHLNLSKQVLHSRTVEARKAKQKQ